MIIEKISKIVKDNLYWENDGVGPLDVGGKPVNDVGKTFLACGISMVDVTCELGEEIPTIIKDTVHDNDNIYHFTATLKSVSIKDKMYNLSYFIEETK